MLLRKVYIKRKVSGESNFVAAFWKSGERGLERERERVKSFVWMFTVKLKIKVVVESYRNYLTYKEYQSTWKG